MEWILLFIAGLFEIAWAVGLKYSKGFSNLWASAFTIVAMIISIALLSLALKKLPLGTAYAIWTGIGAVGTAMFGMLLFAESREPIRLLFILLIIAGIIGLRHTSVH